MKIKKSTVGKFKLASQTGKREVMLNFQMSPRRRQENGIQRIRREETGLTVGCQYTGCTVFLRAGEEFPSHCRIKCGLGELVVIEA